MSGWPSNPGVEALIAQFEKDNPGVTIDYTGLAWPAILTQTSTELLSGTAPDIITVFSGNGNPLSVQTLAKGKYLADLSSSSWVPTFNKANQAMMGADGKILMGSSSVAIIPAIYNKQALEAVGATPPTTWSKVLDLCSTAKAHHKVAFALSASASGGNHTLYPFVLAASLLYGPNPDFVKAQYAGDATFSGSAWTKALAQFRQLMDAGCFTPDATGTTWDTSMADVASGKALGTINVANWITSIEKLAPAGTTFETAAFPATDKAEDTYLIVGPNAGYGVNAKTKHLELAKKFIDFYLSPEGLKIDVENSSDYPSGPVKGGFTPPANLVGVSQQVSGDRTAAIPDQTWPNSVVGQKYSAGLQGFIAGSTSAAQLLQQMDDAWKG
jgi:raffinose/stachyose/melibiose transport system substrate-binding protein